MATTFFADLYTHNLSPRYVATLTSYVPCVKLSDQTSLTGQVPNLNQAPTLIEHKFFNSDNDIGSFTSNQSNTNIQLIMTQFPSDRTFSYLFVAMLLGYMLPQLKYLPSNLNPIIIRGKHAEIVTVLRNIFCTLNLDSKGVSDRSSYQVGFFKRAKEKTAPESLPNNPFFSFILDKLTLFLNTNHYVSDIEPYAYKKSVIL